SLPGFRASPVPSRALSGFAGLPGHLRIGALSHSDLYSCMTIGHSLLAVNPAQPSPPNTKRPGSLRTGASFLQGLSFAAALLQRSGIRRVLRRLLVEVSNHLLCRRRYRYRPMKYDFIGRYFLVIKLLVRVLI